VMLAVLRLLEFGIMVGALIAGAVLVRYHPQSGWALLAAGAVFYVRFLLRIRAAHFSWRANFMAILGLPLFAMLLLRSYFYSRIRGAVTWKGRSYTHSEARAVSKSSIKEGNFVIKG